MKLDKIKTTAFTLIELLVVIAIIGILSGLIIVGMSSSVSSARIAKAQIFSTSLRDSLLMNLVSEWKLDQVVVPSANQTPDSWGANIGTLYGAAGSQNLPQLQTSGCIYGNCLSFDGTDDYINCGTGSNLDITKDITISAWIKPNTLLSDRTILRNGYGINSFTFRQINGRISFGYTHSNGTWVNLYTTNSILTTNFQYVVVTVSSTSLKFYLDGVSILGDITGVNIDNRDVGNAYTSIGNDASSGQYFSGIIDEVRLYNVAIPSSQIKEQHYAGLNRLLANGEIIRKEYLNGIR